MKEKECVQSSNKQVAAITVVPCVHSGNRYRHGLPKTVLWKRMTRGRFVLRRLQASKRTALEGMTDRPEKVM